MGWTAEECRGLAGELLGDMTSRWGHVCAVAGLAQLWVDVGVFGDDLVKAAWLHDIGYSETIRRTGMHAIDGASYLELQDAPHAVVTLVAHHTGAWAEAEERGLTRELLAFDLPDEILLDALTLADLVRGPQGHRYTVRQRLDEILIRYEPQHPVHRAVTRSQHGLAAAAERAANRLFQPM